MGKFLFSHVLLHGEQIPTEHISRLGSRINLDLFLSLYTDIFFPVLISAASRCINDAAKELVVKAPVFTSFSYDVWENEFVLKGDLKGDSINPLLELLEVIREITENHIQDRKTMNLC